MEENVAYKGRNNQVLMMMMMMMMMLINEHPFFKTLIALVK